MSESLSHTGPSTGRWSHSALNLPSGYGSVSDLVNALSWLALLIAVISLLIISGKMVLASLRKNSGEAAEGVSQIPWVLMSVCMLFMAVPFVQMILPGSGISGNISPGFELDGARNQAFKNAVTNILAWGKGIVTVLAAIGILWSAGRMALGKLGGSDLAVEGIGGITWAVFGISLMLLSSVIISGLAQAG